MPLPKPARCNRGYFCRGGSSGHRDITVIKLPDQSHLIKYVEMGRRTRPANNVIPSSSSPRQQVHHSSSDDDDDSSGGGGGDYVRDYWTATIWTMPVPIASWKDCTIDAGNMVIDNPRHRELLLALPGLTVDPQEAAAVTLSRLVTSHPTLGLGLGLDGHVTVYFLTKVYCNAREGWIIVVGTKDNKLQGIARLDERKNFSFRRHYRPTEISKYLTKAYNFFFIYAMLLITLYSGNMYLSTCM
ncbi:uncharacterized protein LOC120700259 [Panicum virgatum]|uniref:uncharacterized protein LOC120700259 n=1 Tax=Panicum virgatum TaxID=38727 RepID=UPI0019D6534B|nr:uncharacterized protein LOC120700259 [Panicum virgatum]